MNKWNNIFRQVSGASEFKMLYDNLEARNWRLLHPWQKEYQKLIFEIQRLFSAQDVEPPGLIFKPMVGAHGCYDHKNNCIEINILPRLEHNRYITTLAHEIAHWIQFHKIGVTQCDGMEYPTFKDIYNSWSEESFLCAVRLHHRTITDKFETIIYQDQYRNLCNKVTAAISSINELAGFMVAKRFSSLVNGYGMDIGRGHFT